MYKERDSPRFLHSDHCVAESLLRCSCEEIVLSWSETLSSPMQSNQVPLLFLHDRLGVDAGCMKAFILSSLLEFEKRWIYSAAEEGFALF